MLEYDITDMWINKCTCIMIMLVMLEMNKCIQR